MLTWKSTLILLFALLSGTWGLAADPDGAERWEQTIRKFEAADAVSPPDAGGIVFVGSSSIRMWDTDRWFPDRGVLNRGFGGSQISDVYYFAERIVLKYKPRTIVFYAGDNDVNKGKSAATVAADFRKFGELVGERLPKCQLIYIPIKPSLARWKLWPEMSKANAAIREYLDQHPRYHYADIVTPTIGDDGQPLPDIFKSDGLHLNDKGYEIWTSVIVKLLDQADGDSE